MKTGYISLTSGHWLQLDYRSESRHGGKSSLMALRSCLVLLLFYFVNVSTLEYYGIKIGTLRNQSYGLYGEVWLVNKTHLQITNLQMSLLSDDIQPSFYFSDSEKFERTKDLFAIKTAHHGVRYSQPIENSLPTEVNRENFVVRIPGNLKQWQYFGIVAEDKWFYLSAVSLNKVYPEPLCCLSDRIEPNRGIVGLFYNAGSDPIVVLDSKTLVLPKFTFDGTKPPDGWIYAGVGKVDQSSGKKAFVVGRDTESHHCAIHEDYHGNTDLVVRLADDQTVFDITYLSVFCFQYSVDFGHIPVRLDPSRNPVPAYVPPVSHGPLRQEPFFPCP
ncbi:hypothetical protein QR680_001828 [Steinernema hermaphroditum]|uniref:DM13 domain-containing protein n=1 Tax=Steinernema hermaphroditum TaxID=289476 RepID=A0AA39LGZ6_9BILA|nr:hypothetical protein QR680_001828 [Steinernema hermaphroditum]